MKYLIYILNVLFLLSACSGKSRGDDNPLRQDSSSALKIRRFDKDLYKYLQDPSSDNQKYLSATYKDFLPAFGRITINNSDSYKPEFYTRLQGYFSNKILDEIYRNTLEAFSDVSAYEKELSRANDIIYNKLNGRRLPPLYMHVSGFKENVMVLDNVISVSIDKYLGEDYKHYKEFFEPYQLRQMRPEMLVRDYLKAWLVSENLLPKEDKQTLLSEMIKEGKILYILSQLLPERTIGDLLGYTPEQFKWCEENEQNIWVHLVKENHLYDTNYQIIQKYINEAPYTSTLTPESPGRAGSWVGWQIVNSYMNKNQAPLSELLLLDSQSILKQSGYNP